MSLKNLKVLSCSVSDGSVTKMAQRSASQAKGSDRYSTNIFSIYSYKSSNIVTVLDWIPKQVLSTSEQSGVPNSPYEASHLLII
jgi:hypothetical protein